VARVAPRGVKKMLFHRVIESVIISSSCGVTCISVGGLIWCRWAFFFFSLSFQKNYSLVILVVGISTSILIILVFDFLS
jgi:hypothetical protein